MSLPFSRLVLASNNPGKIVEFKRLFSPLAIDVVAQGQLGVSESEEPYATFLENALIKARHASAKAGLAALADDSGLCADALDGAPGVHSARFAGEPRSDERNNQALVAALAGHANRRAHYACVLVLVRRPDDPEPFVAAGRLDGEIIDQPRGSNGFGYDPYFFLPERQCTVAELEGPEKDRISHRARAMQELLRLVNAASAAR